jgi:hypothetical protein
VKRSLPLVLVAGVVACSGASVTQPDPVPAAPVVAAPTPEPVPSPSPSPSPVVDSNRPPRIAGELLCDSPINDAHVFPLTITDPEGGRLRWQAQAARPTGSLSPSGEDDIPSGSTIVVTYRPPRDVVDENTIRFVVTDEVGASSSVTLVVRNR